MSISLGKYNKISNLEGDFDTPYINTNIPHPTEVDYKRGYISRYFIQKINDVNSNIFEISKDNFSMFNNNVFYNCVILDWRITGTKEDIKNSNSISVKLASKNMPKLMMYLPNYLQFSK